MDVWSHGAPLATVGDYSERAGLVFDPCASKDCVAIACSISLNTNPSELGIYHILCLQMT